MKKNNNNDVGGGLGPALHLGVIQDLLMFVSPSFGKDLLMHEVCGVPLPKSVNSPSSSWTFLSSKLGFPISSVCPTNNALLINFLLSSDAEILLLSTD